jgi:hypothetical protein
MPDRVAQAPERRQHDRQIVMRFGIVLARQRLADQIRRSFVAPGLMGEKAKEIEALGMAGVARENVTIEPFRLPQFTALMIAYRLREQGCAIGNSRGSRRRCAGAVFGGGTPVFPVHVTTKIMARQK